MTQFSHSAPLTERRAKLAALLGPRGVALIPTAPEQQRIATAITEKAGHWRYHLSRQGLAAYWQGLACPEGLATGGRWRHLLADPRSLTRALLAHDG